MTRRSHAISQRVMSYASDNAIRPGNQRASLAVRTAEQEVHERPALSPQFIHTRKTPFASPVANQCAVLHIHLAKLCPKQECFAAAHRVPFIPHAPRLTQTHDKRACCIRRPRTNQIRSEERRV